MYVEKRFLGQKYLIPISVSSGSLFYLPLAPIYYYDLYINVFRVFHFLTNIHILSLQYKSLMWPFNFNLSNSHFWANYYDCFFLFLNFQKMFCIWLFYELCRTEKRRGVYIRKFPVIYFIKSNC